MRIMATIAAAAVAVLAVVRRRPWYLLSALFAFAIAGTALADTKLVERPPVHVAGKLQAATPVSSGSATFQGQALGGFSGTSYMSSSSAISFAPGQTLWLGLQLTGTTAATTEYLIGYQNPSTAAGWHINRGGAASGAQAGDFLFGSGGAYVFPLSGFVGFNSGIANIAIVWGASSGSCGGVNGVCVSINGSVLTSIGTVAYTACASSCVTTVGAGLSGPGTNPTSDVRVISLATWSTEATATQASQNTFTTGNRFVQPAAVQGAAVVNWQPSRDWNGSASTSTTLGSSPLTLTVAGAPTMTKVDEVRYVAAQKYYADSALAIQTTDGNGFHYTTRESFAHLKAQTDSLVVAVEAYSALSAFAPGESFIGQWVNGSWVSQDGFAFTATPMPTVLEFAPGAGTGKTVDLWEGPCAENGVTPPFQRVCTSIQAVRLPLYLYDGVTSTHSSMLLPSAPSNRLVLLGDSILTAWYVSVPTENPITGLIRKDYPNDGVTAFTAGSDSIGNEAGTTPTVNATAAVLAAELSSVAPGGAQVLWIQLGTNDYGATSISVANFQTYYAALLDAVHALVPSAVVYCQSPIQRISPAVETANAYGFTLGNYRSAINTVCSARSPWALYVEGAASAIVTGDSTHMFSDGIHLQDPGARQYATFIENTLVTAGQLTFSPDATNMLATFDFDPSKSSTLTMSGSTIASAADAAGGTYTLGLSGSSPRPTLDSTDTIGGWPTAVTTSSGNEKLFSASGPAIGSDTAFALYAVAQLYTNAGTSYPAMLTLGSPTAVTDQAVFLGGRLTQWWAGCQDGTLGALGGTVDANPHIFGLEYDGAGNFKIRIDGVLVGGPTACTFNSHSTFPVGFGIAPQYSGNTTAYRLARGLFHLAEVDSTAVRRLHEWYLANRYGLVQHDLIDASGDSLTANAYNDADVGDPTHAYVALLSSQTGMGSWTFTVYNDGHPGWNSAQLATSSSALGQASGARKNNIGVLWIGTNDVFSSIASSTTLTNIATIYNAMLAAGYRAVVVVTLMPWAGYAKAAWDAVNAGILSTYPHVLDLGSDTTLQAGLSVSGSNWTGTYDDVYRVQTGAAAGHLTATGENYVSSRLAPILLSLKQ